MVEDALLEISTEGIHITEKGRLLVRNACMVFDTYLNAAMVQNRIQTYSASADASAPINRPRFSKAI
jgi:oxygen-independent coproporphyrinogen-3 oxidase